MGVPFLSGTTLDAGHLPATPFPLSPKWSPSAPESHHPSVFDALPSLIFPAVTLSGELFGTDRRLLSNFCLCFSVVHPIFTDACEVGVTRLIRLLLVFHGAGIRPVLVCHKRAYPYASPFTD